MQRARFASTLLTSNLIACATLAGGLLAGCGGDDSTACTLGSSEGCDTGQVCEEVMGGEPACFAPVYVEGRVFDALDPTIGIVGATVVAIDANGAPRSTVVTSGEDGAYSLPVPAPRDADGAPITSQVTLRADASGYQTFPTAPRQGIPVDLAGATDTDDDGDREISNASTDIALFEREIPAGSAIVRGTIEGEGAGVLVVAVQGDRAVSSAISDVDGAFVLFDVPPASTSVEGYAAGVRITPATITPTAPETTGVVLTASTDGLSTVTGSVQIVNAPGGSETSVILVLESTFVESVARGESPPGLRAAPVSGTFEIPGVAPGEYVALAAFENDGLVRDPDTSIGGTEIVHLTVPETAGEVALGEGFKVTGALAIVSPGADTIETITDPTPTFAWDDDSSEEGYELRVYDAFGVEIYANTELPSHSGSGDVTFDYPGTPALEPGMVYQFRVWSYSIESDGSHVYKAATEDLRGVFLFQP